MDTLTISLNGIDLNWKNLRIIEQFLDEEPTIKVPEPTQAPKKANKSKSVDKTVDKTLQKDEEQTSSEPDGKDVSERVSLESVINKTRELVQANKSVSVKTLLGKYGVDRVSDLPEDKYNEFYNDLNNIK